MSSCPGLTLEEFISWNYNITVEDQDETNISIGIAEALGAIKRTRPHLTKEEFSHIIAIVEPLREEIEDKLLNYDEEENGSWRDFAGYSFDCITDEMNKQIDSLIKQFKDGTFNATPTTKETKMEYITKELIALLRPYIVLPSLVRNITEGIGVMAANAHYGSLEAEQYVGTHLARTINGARDAVIASPLNFFRAQGPMARYLVEHTNIKYMFSENQSEKDKHALILEEIQRKFNYEPQWSYATLEWSNIATAFIALSDQFLENDSEEIRQRFVQIQETDQIKESGFYLYPNGMRVINLVFQVGELPHTVTLMANVNPLVNVYHPWEEEMVNVYGACYFKGMYKAMMEEVNKLTDPDTPIVV